jgi:hypothetical protein
LIILIILDEKYKLWRSSLRSFLQFPSLHLSSVRIFSSAPCSQTPSVYVPPLMWETVTFLGWRSQIFIFRLRERHDKQVSEPLFLSISIFVVIRRA